MEGTDFAQLHSYRRLLQSEHLITAAVMTVINWLIIMITIVISTIYVKLFKFKTNTSISGASFNDASSDTTLHIFTIASSEHVAMNCLWEKNVLIIIIHNHNFKETEFFKLKCMAELNITRHKPHLCGWFCHHEHSQRWTVRPWCWCWKWWSFCQCLLSGIPG